MASQQSAFTRVKPSGTTSETAFINFVNNLTAAATVGEVPGATSTSTFSTPPTSAINSPISGSPQVAPAPPPAFVAPPMAPLPAAAVAVYPAHRAYGTVWTSDASPPGPTPIKSELRTGFYDGAPADARGSYYVHVPATGVPYGPTTQMLGQLYHANQVLGASTGGSKTPQARAPLSLTGNAMADYAALATTLGADAASRIGQLKRYRESHNEVERRRRENINQVISELAVMVPDCYPGQSKGSILRKTADFLRALQRQGVIAAYRNVARRATSAAEDDTMSGDDDDFPEDDEPGRRKGAPSDLNSNKQSHWADLEQPQRTASAPASVKSERTHSDPLPAVEGAKRKAASVPAGGAKRGRPAKRREATAVPNVAAPASDSGPAGAIVPSSGPPSPATGTPGGAADGATLAATAGRAL